MKKIILSLILVITSCLISPVSINAQTPIPPPWAAEVTPIENNAIESALGKSDQPPAGIVAILLARFFSATLAIGTVFFLFYLVINAWRWLTAGGDSGAISEARQGIINAIIGITILASIFAIANLIAPIIGLSTPTCSFPQQICWPVL